jgi:hypothetical protein
MAECEILWQDFSISSIFFFKAMNREAGTWLRSRQGQDRWGMQSSMPNAVLLFYTKIIILMEPVNIEL